MLVLFLKKILHVFGYKIVGVVYCTLPIHLRLAASLSKTYWIVLILIGYDHTCLLIIKPFTLVKL
jgi:hypothetical protein